MQGYGFGFWHKMILTPKWFDRYFSIGRLHKNRKMSLEITAGTLHANAPLLSATDFMKQRLFSIIEAIAAILMRVLKVAHNCILNISKNTTSNFASGILLSLATPIFK